MALTDLRLSLLAFPQKWTPNSLEVNLLLLPNADPLSPLIAGQPMFAGTTLNLEAVIVIGLDALPAPSSPNTKAKALVVTPPADALALFNKFKSDQAPTSTPLKNLTGVRILKSLPESYTSSFAFEQPRPGFRDPGEISAALSALKIPAIQKHRRLLRLGPGVNSFPSHFVNPDLRRN